MLTGVQAWRADATAAAMTAFREDQANGGANRQ